MMKISGVGKFVAGLTIGASLGVLFAPEKGNVTRGKLKKKLDEVITQIKNIDYKDVKKRINKKIDEIKQEISNLNKEKTVESVKKKAEKIEKKITEVCTLAKESKVNSLIKSTKELKESTEDVLESIIKKLENKKAIS